MKIVINALSTTNSSGRHVLLGHIAQLVSLTSARHRYVILFNEANGDICRDLGESVQWLECPSMTGQWLGRALWERTQLHRVVRETGAAAVFSTSGHVTSGLAVPQAAIAMNPWALVSGLDLTPTEQLKAMAQRHAYRKAVRDARAMAFLSGFMKDAYNENAGRPARSSWITYAGIDEATFAAAERARPSSRMPYRVVAVSVMARHKAVETVVAAISRLRKEYEIPATLLLVGGWPDSSYRLSVERQVHELGLEEAVTFAGHVSREELNAAYAESQVYCLMSRCESFGIPAVEAQTFGTPVVSSNCCAIPEVCGEGGVYPELGRDDQVAAALFQLLTDRSAWEQKSEAALRNAERFRWERCSPPFVEMIDELAGGV